MPRHAVRALGSPAPRGGDELTQVAPTGKVMRQRYKLEALLYRKLGPRQQFQAPLFRRHMRAHHPGHRAFVRNSERRVAQCMRACYQLLCVRGTALEAEVGEAVQFGVFERQRGGFHYMRVPSTPAIRLASQWPQLITG